ncbi:MAG: 3',5'-nucleoside bisphosphate phosphatase [Casimicrobiaceae bacterium]
MIRYDLHCHSTHSDGLLAPGVVAQRAASRGVDVWALTDHDETSGLDEARAAATEAGIRFINGAELSVSWNDVTLHIVALGIDPGCAQLLAGLHSIRKGRDERAHRMADSLAEAGIPGAFEGAAKYVTNPRLIGRTHFARFLVESGKVNDTKAAFQRFLTKGKPGYVTHEWATLTQALDWIHVAGGQAVLAHPGRYPIETAQMRLLLGEFRDAGGDAIEVLTASHTQAQTTEYARFARVFGLLASSGSDYHGPGESWADLGDMPQLPAGVTPVWKDW